MNDFVQSNNLVLDLEDAFLAIVDSIVNGDDNVIEAATAADIVDGLKYVIYGFVESGIAITIFE